MLNNHCPKIYFHRALCTILIVLLSASLYGQQKKLKPKYFFNVNGAGLIEKNSVNTFSGFNLMKLGWSKNYDKRLHGFELEIFRYKKVEISRFSINTGLFQAFQINKNLFNGLYLGYFSYLGYNKENFTPLFILPHRKKVKCYCMSIGPRMEYLHKIKQNIYLNIGTNIYLFEVGFHSRRILNPRLTERQQKSSSVKFNFLPERFQLLIGLSFRL